MIRRHDESDGEEQQDQSRRPMWMRVPIPSLFTSPYQRQLIERHVKRLVRRWDDDAMNVLIASYHRPNRYALIDGQQRLEAYKRVLVARGCDPRSETVACWVHFNLSYEDEARLFVKSNSMKPPTALENFNGRLEGNEPTAVLLSAVLGRYGMRVAVGTRVGSDHPGLVNAIVAAESVMRVGGVDQLDRVIRILNSAYGDDRHAYVGGMLRGVDYFLARYDIEPSYSEKRLVDRLRVTPLGDIERLQRGMSVTYSGSGLPGLWGHAILTIYNHGLRNRLPSWDDPTVAQRAQARSGRRSAE
jgi:hypothetical protein